MWWTLLREAAIDPSVRPFKSTCTVSPRTALVINALVNAARNGKRVEVVVELAARFDEKQNIRISNMLKEAGVVVRIGIPKLKVHCQAHPHHPQTPGSRATLRPHWHRQFPREDGRHVRGLELADRAFGNHERGGQDFRLL